MNPEDIRIVKEQPPFLLQIELAGMKPEKTTIFPFGFKIYNPSGLPIPADIMIHEVVHIRQQLLLDADSLMVWWGRYIFDKDFRLKQELEANREQYKFFCKVKKDRNERARALFAIAKNMAGEVYGNMLSVNEAMELIKK